MIMVWLLRVALSQGPGPAPSGASATTALGGRRDCCPACWTRLDSRRASLMAQKVKNLPAMQDTQEMQVRSLGQKDPPE